MARLKGIVYGLLGTFVSRNNDIDGYWGLGVLRLYAEKRNASEIIIDLMNVERLPVPHSPITATKNKYSRWLASALANARIEPSRLRRAEIKVKFSTFDEFPNTIRDTRGEPYICTVALTSDNGVTYEELRHGCCAPHDPKTDRRSTRAV